MLHTPLGDIEIYIDGKETAYKEYAVSPDRNCPDLGGRYCIAVDFRPDGIKHCIACRIKGHIPGLEDSVESGERLESKGFYNESVKVSIGMEGETGYIGAKRISEYDYDNGYLKDGVQYEILSFTKTRRYIFGVAWIENPNGVRDIQTWFGADPTMMTGTNLAIES